MYYPLLLLISPVWGAIMGEWDDPLRDSIGPNFGHRCDSQEHESNIEANIKWYVDGFREKVYPFLFLGCGGDENKYDSMLTARQALPKDTSQCIGFNMTGWPDYQEEDEQSRCPKGSSYLPYGEFAAICCDRDTKIRYEKELVSICPNGEEPLKHTVVYIDDYGEAERDEEITLIGKNCSHDFCPQNTQYYCVQGEFEARCCPLPSTTAASPTDIAYETASSSEQRHPQPTEAEWVNRRILVIVAISIVIFSVLSLFCTCIICKSRRNRRLLSFGNEKETSALNP